MMNNITRKRERKKTEIAIFNITLLYLVTANYNIITKQRTTAGQPVTKQSGRNVGRKKTTAEKQGKRTGNLGGNQGQALLDHLTRPYIK